MFRLSRVLLKEDVVKSTLKTTTGLVGIAVDPLAIDKLFALYDRTVRALSNLPETSVYRNSTIALTNNRWNILKNSANAEEIESKINAGQIEELIIQANNELQLVEKMLELKPWEDLETQIPVDQWVYKYKKN